MVSHLLLIVDMYKDEERWLVRKDDHSDAQGISRDLMTAEYCISKLVDHLALGANRFSHPTSLPESRIGQTKVRRKGFPENWSRLTVISGRNS